MDRQRQNVPHTSILVVAAWVGRGLSSLQGMRAVPGSVRFVQCAYPPAPAMSPSRFAAYSRPPSPGTQEANHCDDESESPRVVRCDHRHRLLAICGVQCGAGILRLRVALRLRYLDWRLGLSRWTSGYLTAAVFLRGRGIDRHGALVLIITHQ